MTTPQEKVYQALANFATVEKEFNEVRDRLAELTRAYLQARAQQDHPDAKFVAFTFENTYFGHGQSGPVVSTQLLYDAEGKPLRIVSHTKDENEPWYESDGYFDDEGWVWQLLALTAEPETSDSTVYVLNLETGLYTDDPLIPLQEWPEEEA